MIGWQNPGAFWALLILAAPVLVHMLRRHRADRVLFPSLRFVRTAQTSATRVRRPSDVMLLVVRMGVLAFGIAAIARPVVVTPSRVAMWNASTARAVVVDTSASMRASGADSLASEAAGAELASSALSRRFDARVIADGLTRASTWLASTPPSRKEIVVISDAQRGALDASSTANAPEGIGIRFVRVGNQVANRRVDGPLLLDPAGDGSLAQALELVPEGTGAVIERRASSGRTGIRVLPDSAYERLMRIVARAGAIAGSSEQPIVVRFATAAPVAFPGSIVPVPVGWMTQRIRRMQTALTSARELIAGAPTLDAASIPWTIVVADADGKPIVAAAAAGSALVLDVAAPPDSLLAAAIVRAALNARVSPRDYDEQEIARIDSGALDAWMRPAAPVDSSAWRNADVTDARWCWLTALLLLGIEQWLRARKRAEIRVEVAPAA
jgi:hypothetical protein